MRAGARWRRPRCCAWTWRAPRSGVAPGLRRVPPAPWDVPARLGLSGAAARRGRPAAAGRRLGLGPRAVGAAEPARRQLARALGRTARTGGDRTTLLRCVLAGFP